MSTFRAQLIAARKAKGYTQEKLAELMNVSRPTISHWENGRALPDLELLGQLSQVLEYDFQLTPGTKEAAETAAVPEAAAPEASAPVSTPEPAPAPAPAKRPSKRWLAIVAAALAVVLVVTGVLLHQRAPAETAVIQPTGPKTFEEYKQAHDAQQPVEGQAFLNVHTSEDVITPTEMEDSDRPMWMYQVLIEETNGVDFTVESVHEVRFADAIHFDVFDYALDGMGWGDARIPANGCLDYWGGFPVQPFDGIGVEVAGTDANGNHQTFYGTVSFSAE